MISIGLNIDKTASLADFIVSTILLATILFSSVVVHDFLDRFLPVAATIIFLLVALYFVVASFALFIRRMNFRKRSRLHCLWLIAPMIMTAVTAAELRGVNDGVSLLSFVIAVIGGVCGVIACCLAFGVDAPQTLPDPSFQRIWNVLVLLLSLGFTIMNFLGLLIMRKDCEFETWGMNRDVQSKTAIVSVGCPFRPISSAKRHIGLPKSSDGL